MVAERGSVHFGTEGKSSLNSNLKMIQDTNARRVEHAKDGYYRDG